MLIWGVSGPFGVWGIRITYRPRCLWDNGGSVVVVRPFRAGVRSMCSFVHANVTLGSPVVLPAKGSTRLQSCVLHNLISSVCNMRDGALAVAWNRVYMVSRNVICLSFLFYISHSCYISGVLVIYLEFLLYISHSCYMPGGFVIYLVFLLYQPVSCYTIL